MKCKPFPVSIRTIYEILILKHFIQGAERKNKDESRSADRKLQKLIRLKKGV